MPWSVLVVWIVTGGASAPSPAPADLVRSGGPRSTLTGLPQAGLSLPDASAGTYPAAPAQHVVWPAALAKTGFYFGVDSGVSAGHFSWAASGLGNLNEAGTTSIFHLYQPLDGSGSQFGGFDFGYSHPLSPRLVIGAEANISFAAEPIAAEAPVGDTAEFFGGARGRLGLTAHRWLYFLTGGLAWSHDQFTLSEPQTDPTSSNPAVYAPRVGWTIGGGLETTLAAGWTAKAEYSYARFGSTTVAFPSGAQVSATGGMHLIQVGLNYWPSSTGSTDLGTLGLVPLVFDSWSLHGQTTYDNQYALPFRDPYSGPNSLASNAGKETWDATLYLGHRLWQGAQVWLNPEIDQGFGLSNTLGVAGFTSGEAYKVGFTTPYVRIPRLFICQTFNLGGATEKVGADLNQLPDTETANRLVVTAGKFSVTDIFDGSTYAHDPRNDFMNWAIIDAGTFDYAADAWGFTQGATVEWYEGSWVGRVGLFDLSIVPNSVTLDPNLHQFQLIYSVEHGYSLRGRPGKVALVGFLSHGRMGRFDDALAFGQETGQPPNTANVRRIASRPGIHGTFEQEVADGVGVFARAGWANGDFESYEFTDIDRTVSGGVSFAGKRWGRPNDTFAVAAVVNGISASHTAYLAAGGLGILVGDGQLPHPGNEEIIETYYRLPLIGWQTTGDYQLVINPGYNRDRGPVSVVSVRIRAQF